MECPVKVLFSVGVFITPGFLFSISAKIVDRFGAVCMSRLLIKLIPSCLHLASVTFRLMNLLLASCV